MQWFEIAKLVASILAGVIVALCNIAISKRKKNTPEAEKPQEAGIPAAVKDYIIDAVEEAEQSGLKGVMKKSYALSLIVLKCVSLGINYNDIETLVSDYIEELITLTKKVN